ncbi:MAG: hypothetical protein IK088_04905 [Lachnospiraceae bacterium]|nr:hypothetical protein [Lachnospiraceae bacterium]
MKPNDDREAMIRRNVQGTLEKVREVLGSMEETLSDPRRFVLPVTHVSIHDARYYSVFVPEGYRIAGKTEEYVFVLYRPNPANPDSFEASDTVLYESVSDAETFEDGRVGNRFLVRKQTETEKGTHTFTVVLKNVNDTDETVLRRFTGDLFQTIIF